MTFKPVALLALVGLACTLPGCNRPRVDGSLSVSLAAYTSAREVYEQAIIPGFQRHWKNETGQDVEFRTSYLPSAAQASAIVGGNQADVAALALEEDVDQLVQARLVDQDWRRSDAGGIFSTSLVVIAVREGNPANVRGWADLARPGLTILTPDPRTSGGGRWNVCALYGAALDGAAGVRKYDRDAAREYLANVFRNVHSMKPGARESIEAFRGGEGDVALTYESELRSGALSKGGFEYVVPESTLVVELPVAVLDRNARRHGTLEVARGFVKYLESAEAQQVFARYGLRPTSEEVAREVQAEFPPALNVQRIGALGGWTKATEEIFGTQGAFTRAYQETHIHE